jgi:hypothetical protein
LYFHRACYDGAVSALLAWEYLDLERPGGSTALHSVGYDLKKDWLSRPLSGATVVDFLFHPDAGLWIDHHSTTFLSPDVEAEFRRTSRPNWIYDPNAASCAGLLSRWLADRGHRASAFASAVEWADRIDGANYPSPAEAVFPSAPAPLLAQSFSIRRDDAYSVLVVKLLRHHDGDVARVIEETKIRTAVDAVARRFRSGLERLKLSFHESDRGIFVFDVTEDDDAIVSRYAPYMLDPQALYSVGTIRLPGELKITTMRNPWLDFPSVDLGRLCSEFGGGGHHRVGSILLRGPNAEHAPQIVRALVDRIHRGF